MNQPGHWVDEVNKHKPIEEIILDIDSSGSPTFGRQEGSAYNGHFGYTCYHPLFIFNQLGDIERALLRHGNVYSSDDWKSVLEPVVGVIELKISPDIFVVMPPLPTPKFTAFLKPKIISMRYG